MLSVRSDYPQGRLDYTDAEGLTYHSWCRISYMSPSLPPQVVKVLDYRTTAPDGVRNVGDRPPLLVMTHPISGRPLVLPKGGVWEFHWRTGVQVSTWTKN